MKKMSALAKKLCAMIISAMLIIGAIPIAMATDDLTEPDKIPGGATPDEAETLPDNTVPDPAIDPSFEVNLGAQYCFSDSNELFFTGKELTSLTVKVQPDSSIYEVIEADFNANNKTNAKVYLEYAGTDYDHTPDTEFEASNGILTAVLDFLNPYNRNGLPSGDYIYKLKYFVDGSEQLLYSKSFHVANESPSINNLKYDSKDSPEWSKNDVKVTFDVDSPIIASVTVNDEIIPPVSGSSYSYTATESGSYTIVVKDKFNHTTTKETHRVLVDKVQPTVSAPVFCDEEGAELTGWYNKPITVKLTVSDSDSGIDEESFTVSGVDNPTVEKVESNYIVSFKADKIIDYKLTCMDKAGNPTEYTVKKEDIHLDTQKPVADDFTLSFSSAKSTGDQILNFLSFGLYDNQDIKVSVAVSNAGQSDIDVNSIKLYNGDTLLEKIDGTESDFLIKAPENDGEALDYDLYVEATDKAENESGKISLKKTKVKTKLPNGTEILQEFSEELFEVVISKVVPDFDKDGLSFDFEHKTSVDTKVYVTGEGTVSVKVSEPASGIKTVKATIDEKDAEVSLTPDNKDSKATELTASFAVADLEAGEHEFTFVATANSGMSETFTASFMADNSAPALDGEFSVPTDGGKWSNSDVTVSVKLKDEVEINSVKYYNSTENPEAPAEGLKDAELADGIYTLKAETYGKYTVLVEDILGNQGAITTETEVLIDTEKPEVASEFEYSKDYSNKPIDVTFTVKDNPEICSGVKSVTVDGEPASKVSDKENTYQFSADHYGTYEVVVTDNAGNDSEAYQAGPVPFDDIAPTVKKFEFSSAKSVKDYGVYNNEALSLTVTVENTMNDADAGAALKTLELREDGKALSSEFQKAEGNNYTLTYIITAENKLTSLSVFAEDKAENSVENSITDNSVEVLVDSSAISNTKLSEIVVSKQTPSVGGFVPSFTQNKLSSAGEMIYSGSGEFSASLSDALSGIDSYTTYFVESKDVVIKNNNITNLDKLPVQKTVENISDKSKQTSQTIKVDAKLNAEDISLASGKYTAVVSAVNLSGNSIVKFTEVTVDNDAPIITEVKISTNGGTVNNNGIYTSNPISVELVGDDGEYSAGIAKFELFNEGNNKLSESTDGKFEISESGRYLFYGLATDVFGNKLDEREDLKTKKIVVNGTQLNNESGVFEIVINASPEETISEGIHYEFHYNNSANVFKENASDDGNIWLVIKNELIGIKSTNATVTNIGTGQKENVKVDKSDNVMDKSFGKLVSQKISVNVAGLPTGAYTVDFTATNLGDVQKTFSGTFYIDKTAPTVESITYEKTSEAADKLLNLLTFGLYSNENIKVSVKVSDAAPSSGISADDIKLTSKTGLKITDGKYTTESESAPEADGVYVKTFTLGVSSEVESSFYSDLHASVTDKYDNSSDGGFREYNNFVNGESMPTDEAFEIVSSTVAPTVSDVAFEGNNCYEKGEEKALWFSKGPKLSFTSEDNTSKIHSVNVTLNGTDVTSFCSYDAGDYKGETIPAEFTSFGAGLSNTKFSISIKKIDVQFDTTKTSALQEGENTVVINVTGNNGVSTNDSDYTYKFNTDYTAPVIKDGSLKFARNADKVWTNQDVDVTFTADDGAGVGLDILEIFRNGVKVPRETCNAAINTETGACSFTAKEYGTYSAKLTDLNGNYATYELGTILIDKAEPTVAKVDFAPADSGAVNKKSYGVYSNSTIKMTVTIDNDKAGYDDNAPLSEDAVTASSDVSEKEKNIAFKGRNEGTNEYVFFISPVEGAFKPDDFDIQFAVSDTAQNESKAQLSDKGILVEVDPSLEQYEVIATLNKPSISKIGVIFSNDAKNDDGSTKSLYNTEGVPVHSGNGMFTATITDQLANIDRYNAFFVKTGDLKFDANEQITNLAEFTPVASESGISDAEKTKEKSIEFKSTNPNALESGNYTAVVEAYSLSGNSFVTYTSFVVDNTPPQVDKIVIETTSTDDTITDNGIYTAKPVTVTIHWTDGDFSAGVETFELFNDEKLLDSNSKGVFTISDDGIYHLRALITDKFGQRLDSSEDLKTVPIEVKSKQGSRKLADSHKDNFEIVINNDPEKISFSDFKNDFHYHTNTNIYNIYKNFGNDGFFRITASNEVSGIKSNRVAVKNVKTKAVVIDTFSLEAEKFADYNRDKKINNTIVVDASELPTGDYTIEFTVTDLGGIENSFSEEFYIDKTEPVVESIKYEKAESPADKLLNLLTFGIYSNTDIKATVTVTDVAPSAGIVSGGIKMTSETGKAIDDSDFSEVTASSPTEKGEYTKSFILKAGSGADDSFYNDLHVSAADIFDNGTDGNFREYKNLFSDDSEISVEDFGSDPFEIVSTTKTPDIEVIDVTGSDKYTDNNGKLWFSANPSIDFTVTDNVSKIHAVTVKLNDTDVTEYTDFGDADELSAGVFTDFDDHSGDKISNISATLDTQNEHVKGLVNEGENTITITATGNNGSTSNVTTQKFYLDTKKPVIQKFEFSGNGYSDVDGTPRQANYVETDYGFFFRDTTIVTVTATDDIVENISGSGVEVITLITTDINGTKNSYSAELNVGDRTASFTIPALFKGTVSAFAYDRVKNNEDGGLWYNPENAVVETENQHFASTNVEFSLPETSFRDNSNQKLYPNLINISFTAESTFAGIREVKYSVTSKYDQANDYSGTISIGHDGSASEQIDSSVRFVDGNGNTTNLVSKLTKTLSIKNNSNDIIVKVTVIDRAGWGTEKEYSSETFSIDTIEPRIQVDWNPEQGNQVANGDFYKADRVATITVTERNFNPDDFKLTITNTDGSIPSLVAGEAWSTSYGFASDPDATIHKATITFHNDGDYNMETAYTDLAGHASPDNGKKEKEFTIDQTLPKISISFDKNNASTYYNETRTATIRIDEHNFISDSAYLSVKQNATGPDNSTSVTPPSVSGWSTSGDVSTATITFASDGKYSFTVDFKDKALNEATQEKASEFYIDKKIDKLEIVNVEDLTAYDDTVAPVINYFDNNFAEGTYTLKRIDYGKDPEAASNLTPNESSGGGYSKVVAYSDFARIEENDGIYQLNAHIKDKAGNEENTDVLFSVNRFGSTFMISDDDTKKLLEEQHYTNNAPDVVITEINVNDVSDPVVQINRDDSTRTLESGKDYEIIQNSGGRQSWFAYDYKVLKQNFESEGNYVVTVTSTDKFNNVISNRTAYKETDDNKEQIDRTCPVAFVVDKTAPIVTITGINNDEYYEEAAKNVIINCDDANITSEYLKVEFDGQELERDSDYEITSETSGNVEVRLELEADGKDIDRDFKVTISDKANNFNDLSEGGEITGFRLSASWIARLLHYNLPIVIIAGSVLLAGIALAVVLIVRKRGKTK